MAAAKAIGLTWVEGFAYVLKQRAKVMGQFGLAVHLRHSVGAICPRCRLIVQKIASGFPTIQSESALCLDRCFGGRVTLAFAMTKPRRWR